MRRAMEFFRFETEHHSKRTNKGQDGKGRSAMKAIIWVIAATLFSACSTVSPRDAMQADVDQATAIIERFEAIPEKGIPPAVMRAARGLAILTVTKAGFIGSARGVLELSLRAQQRVGAARPQSVRGELASVFKPGSKSPNSSLSSILRLLLTRLLNRATLRLAAT